MDNKSIKLNTYERREKSRSCVYYYLGLEDDDLISAIFTVAGRRTKRAK